MIEFAPVASTAVDHLRIILPLPSIEGSNSRSHWCVRQRSAKLDRFAAAVEARIKGVPCPLTNPVVVVDWYCKTKRMLDCDNALSRCKSYIDGLTDAGWWIDDKQIKTMIVSVYAPGEGAGFKGRVVITAIERPPKSSGLLRIDPSFG
jgi:Holliday junction resolvase RusA-like endonuclease